MNKIKSLFQRNYDGDKLVRNEVVPGSEWVVSGEGIATQKHDGTCSMIRGGKLFKRYDAKHGRTPPEDFELVEHDEVTGHIVGWAAVSDDNPADRWHREGLAASGELPDGTYELCGEKVQGNPENVAGHKLIRHGSIVFLDVPRDFDGLREYFKTHDIEGVVWHHADGRRVKIKARDFGIKRQPISNGEQTNYFDDVLNDSEYTDKEKIEKLHECAADYFARLTRAAYLLETAKLHHLLVRESTEKDAENFQRVFDELQNRVLPKI